jgi:hypothetical protein
LVRDGLEQIGVAAGLPAGCLEARNVDTFLQRLQDTAQQTIAEELVTKTTVLDGLADLAAGAGDPKAVEAWMKDRLTSALDAAAEEVGKQTELIQLLADSKWEGAFGKLVSLDEAAALQLIDGGLLPREALPIRGQQNAAEAAQQLAASFRTHLAQQLAASTELGLPAEAIEHFLRNDPKGLQHSLADWQSGVIERVFHTKGDGTHAVTELWNNNVPLHQAI